jgi:hypothetical protein
VKALEPPANKTPEADELVYFGANGGCGCKPALDARHGQPLSSEANIGDPNVLARAPSHICAGADRTCIGGRSSARVALQERFG